MTHAITVLAAAFLCAAAFAKETVVIVPAHPDDLISSIGFCLLARDRFDVHVVDFTHGERGLGQKAFEDGSCRKIRMAEEESVCRRLAEIIKELKPRAVFAHWPVDIHTDHVMAGAAALRAVFLSGLKPEVYFFDEVYQAKCFIPDRYLDITDVFERKYEILRMYKCQYRDGGIEHRQKACDKVNGMRTAMLGTGCAESFRSLYPPLQGE